MLELGTVGNDEQNLHSANQKWELNQQNDGDSLLASADFAETILQKIHTSTADCPLLQLPKDIASEIQFFDLNFICV